VHQSLCLFQILRSLQVANNNIEVASQVVGDFNFPCLADVADRLNQLLVGSFHTPIAISVNLKTNVLDLVFVPGLKLNWAYKK
jgi:hypothetical protein